MLDLTVLQARDLNEAWYLCVREAYLSGREYVIQKGSFEGEKRREIPLVDIEIEYPGTRPLSPTVPEGIPPVATEEDIQQYLLYLMTDTKKPGEDYTYGEDLGPQIPEVISRYKEWGFDNNRLCMSVGSRDSLFEYRKEEEGKKASSQCLRLVDTRIQDGKLHFIVYFRSWDLWSGFPINMGGLQLMKEYMASEIGVGDGKLIAISKGLHLYEHTFDLAKSLLRIEDPPKILKAIRFTGTNKVKVEVHEVVSFRVDFLQGKRYDRVKDLVLRYSDKDTEFYHYNTPENPDLPTETLKVDREDW